MHPAAPVIIVDDDTDDQQLIKEVWKELKFDFPLIFFNRGKDLLNYLHSGKENPFIVISDVNLPKMDGFELREKILNDPSAKYKGIPFIFWSGTASEEQIRKAYDLSSHGFFIKDADFEELKNSFSNIISYWLKSETPESSN